MRRFLPKIVKGLTPTRNDKKLTYSNSSLELWIETKYDIDLIPVESYKKDSGFLMAMTLKDIANDHLKLKVFLQKAVLFKVNALLFSNTSFFYFQYSGATRSRKKFSSDKSRRISSPTKAEKENLIIN